MPCQCQLACIKKTGFGISEPQTPKSKCAGLTKHILPGLASYGQNVLKIEDIFAGALSQ